MEGLITFAVEGILKSVVSLAAQEIGLFRGFENELTELHQSSLEIQQYLGDVAHKPQDRGMAVTNWVKKLKDVADDADDVLEDINYEVLRRKVEIQNHMKKVLNFFSLSNPILFRQKMAHKIKNINASLAVLNSEASRIKLVARRVDHTPPPIMRNRETDSRFGQYDKIIGREEIVSDIIKILMSKNQEKNLSVMAVVGIGGLGKTTLAKSIFNYDAIPTPFVEKMWVCVSDTSDVNSILNRMLESLKSNRTGLTSRQALLDDLTERLTDKRYILILDDVWNEEENFWRDFKNCLSKLNSGPGSIAIVTTRKTKVASITETMPTYNLKGLSEEDCWSVLKGEALPDGNASSLNSDQECIGRAIAKKCAGVPLTAKVLGSLMRSQEWSSILESKIWELRDGEDQIMSILKLSFDNLREPSLKQCFAYCSMFEKDCDIEKDDLVQLWMAQGYLHSSPNVSMEDIGNEYFNILLQNSLFQDASEDEDDIITECKMHDLVHDLAEEVFKFESLTRDMDLMDDHACEIQHVAQISSTTLERIAQGSTSRLQSLFVDCEVPSNIFERFRGLRMLNLCEAKVEELPSSIGKLKRLRYLNISWTGIKELPKSIGKLYNLQTLRMSNTDIKTFPREMKNLINLRHVYFDEDKEVPFGMTRLIHLQTLPSFILDEDGRHRLDELGGLNELKGELVIGSLEFVRDKEEAVKANLVGKTNIRKLNLKWRQDHSADLDQDVLERLEPQPNLERLRIEGFKGTKFASWMMSDSLLIKLTEIKLICWRECEAVPPLGYLANLRRISIKQCPKLKSFPISQSQSLEELRIKDCPKLRCTSIHSLPSLRLLVVEGCTSLEESENLQSTTTLQQQQQQQEDLSLNGCTSLLELNIRDCNGFTSILSGLHSCTSLRTLHIYRCRNLRTLSGHGLQTPVTLERMHIESCPNLEAIPSLDNLTSLSELRVRFCDNLISLADHNVSSLQSLPSLHLFHCGKLQYLPKGLHSLSRLEDLSIGAFCEELDSFPDFQVPSKLKELRLYGWPKLKSLPQQIQHSASLTKLEIRKFDGLEALPEWLGNLTSLTDLDIRDCHGLRSLPSGLAYCTSLTDLSVSFCRNLEAIPSLDNLTSLTNLYIWGCDGLRSLPSGLAYCTSLTYLVVSFCPNLEAIPSLDNLTSLTHLNIRDCHGLISLPSGLAYCKSLTKLQVSFCDNLISLADHNVSSLQSLSSLDLSYCGKLQYLPKGLHSLSRLEVLRIGPFSEELDSFPDFQVPSKLKELELKGWPKLKSLPQQIQHSASLTSLSISGFDGLEALPEWLGNLTSLTDLDIRDCHGLRSLPSGLAYCTSLTQLDVWNCPKDVWNCPNLEAIPSLDNLTSLTRLRISSCDGLISLPSGLAYCTSLTHLSVSFCRNLEAIPSLDNLTSLTNLDIFGCDGLRSLPSGLAYCTSLTELRVIGCSNLISLADHNVSSLQSLSHLELSYCGKLQYLPKGLHSLSRLEDLSIGKFCEELDSFPDFQVPSKLKELELKGWPKLKSLPQQIQHSASLTSLSISGFDGLEALPEWLGNLTSLTRLSIWQCENLMYLPTVEAMQRLTKLQALTIWSCPRLEERCAKDSGPEWPKISHIPDLRFLN